MMMCLFCGNTITIRYETLETGSIPAEWQLATVQYIQKGLKNRHEYTDLSVLLA